MSVDVCDTSTICAKSTTFCEDDDSDLADDVPIIIGEFSENLCSVNHTDITTTSEAQIQSIEETSIEEEIPQITSRSLLPPLLPQSHTSVSRSHEAYDNRSHSQSFHEKEEQVQSNTVITLPPRETQLKQLVTQQPRTLPNPFLREQKLQNPFTVTVTKNPFISSQTTIARNPFIQEQRNPFLVNQQTAQNIEEIVKRRVAEEMAKQKPILPETPAPQKEEKKHRKRKTDVTQEYKVVDENTVGNHIKNLIPKGHTLIETAAGNFIVPLYDKMSFEEQQRRRSTFKTQYKSFNITWEGKFELDMPEPDETLTNIDVRFQQAIRYIKQKNGCNFPKLFMIFCWGAIEVIAKKMGIAADGYFTSQLMICDVYESKMIQLGEGGGFGEDWPAWIQLVVLSGVNLILIIMLNKFLKGKEGIVSKPDILRGVSNFISGKSSTLAAGADGIPKPSDDPVSNAIGINLGGMNVTNMVTGLIGGMGSFFGGDDDEEEEEKPKRKRRAGRARKEKKKEAPKGDGGRGTLPDEI